MNLTMNRLLFRSIQYLTLLAFAVLSPRLYCQASMSSLSSARHNAAAEAKEISAVLNPFWGGSVMSHEPVLAVAANASTSATAQLLFPADNILSVTSSDGSTLFEPGRDYLWTHGSRSLTLTPDSRIPKKTLAELFPPKGSPGTFSETADGTKGIFFREGGGVFQSLQVVVTYTHSERWAGFVPKPSSNLSATLVKLRSHHPLKLVVLGDSISHGACASATFGGPPFQPPYVGLVAETLQAEYATPVTLVNLSVGGKTSSWGTTQINAVVEENPDLLIIAFGMNDAFLKVSPTEYANNVRMILEHVRQRVPTTDIVLVATMTGNPDWIKAHQDLYFDYRTELLKVSGTGIAVADMTSMWRALLEHKSFWDLTGNGINHPNDFGHLVYAQTVVALLQPQ